jgi:hypothetical protein
MTRASLDACWSGLTIKVDVELDVGVRDELRLDDDRNHVEVVHDFVEGVARLCRGHRVPAAVRDGSSVVCEG